MYVAMNRFTVFPEKEAEFEQIWKERETYLRDVPGFVRFALLRGEEAGQYISHSMWADRAAFQAWTESVAFTKGHQQGSLQGILSGPPALELFQAVIEEEPGRRAVDDSLPEAGRTGPRH